MRDSLQRAVRGEMRRTLACDTDDEFLARDPGAHAEQDLVPGVEVVECATERGDGEQWRLG